LRGKFPVFADGFIAFFNINACLFVVHGESIADDGGFL
jgi:hypothetical protein